MATGTNALRPASAGSWLWSFRNLLSKENNLRWGKLRYLLPALVWVAILNGFILLVAYTEADGGGSTAAESAVAGTTAFLTISTIATAIGVVIGAQGAIIGEKQLGTAAWVLSKPASRSAFILAKLASLTITFLGLAVVLPSVVFFGQSQLFWGQMPALITFVAGGAVLVLHLLFYLALVLMLGTLFGTRGPVAGIGLGLLLAGRILPSFMPEGLLLVTPWKLLDLAPVLALGSPLPVGWYIPVTATLLLAVLFMGMALWRFGREEF